MTDTAPVNYTNGRMQYHPDYHAKHKKPWTTTDVKYLLENYVTLGPEEVSLTLERTIQSVMSFVWSLRKAGRMPPPPANRKNAKRMKPAKDKPDA